MEYAPKRKSDGLDDPKKLKNYVNEREREAYTSSKDWPVYLLPGGGILKVSPWGLVKQIPNPATGEMITKFEDTSFQDYSFDSEAVNSIYEMPSTPQSLCPPSRASPSPASLRLSPSDEAELYVMDGYLKHQAEQQQRFVPEHENYFGMGDENDLVDDSKMHDDDMMN